MTYVPAELRREVIQRAGNCCEYCLLSQQEYPFAFHMEHIISEKHEGQTISDNLALSCPTCNTFKGSDVAAIDPETEQATLLFHPRRQLWADHFKLEASQIAPLTPEGRVTVFLLRLNSEKPVQERQLLIRPGLYPCHQIKS